MENELKMEIADKPKKKFFSLKLVGFALLLASFIFLFVYDAGVAIFVGFICLAFALILKDNKELSSYTKQLQKEVIYLQKMSRELLDDKERLLKVAYGDDDE